MYLLTKKQPLEPKMSFPYPADHDFSKARASPNRTGALAERVNPQTTQGYDMYPGLGGTWRYTDTGGIVPEEFLPEWVQRFYL